MRTWAVWRDNAAVWREIFGVCWRRSRVLFLSVCICMALDTFAIAGIGLALRAVVTGTTESRGALIVLGAAGAAFGYAADVTFSELTFSMRINLCELVAREHYDRQIQLAAMGIEGIEHLEQTEYLDKLTSLEQTWAIGQSAWSAVEAFALVARLFLVLGLLGSISPVLLVILVAGVVPLYFEQRSRTVIQAADEARSQDKRLQRRLFEILTGGATGKEVRVAGTSAHLVRLQREAAERSERVWLRANLEAGFLGALGWSIFVAAFVAGLAVVVDDAAHNPAHLGDIVLTITVGTQLRSLVQNAVRASTNTGGSGRILEPYRWLRAYQAEHVSAATNPAPDGLREGITFEDVTFTYANSGHPALAGLSVHLPAGSIVAIVGEYGSGKTTIVKLLEKMYRPTSGRILVDGVDLATIDTRAWRSSTAAAFQDFGRYQSTFAQAIALGDLEHPERLAEAVAHADAQSLVDRLPDGLDTQLGRAFDGVDLSEGQWQKLALARASMRQAPLLFVLDEPTASLDAPSEHAIFERYMERARAIAPGGITVIVSHRFSTVAGADLILVLDKGRLADAGTHEELLAASPTYAALYSLQQTAYAGP
ncbi:ABC transporter ATP-binding protein [Actinospica sp. MGRD01-02]|uniref:ABC transporter ATP-binding protein n=1 Tax=Actinospica acidithermotolerans TaxID=2828514 RepID=A0A941E9K0_9ACTN|nr:ABC transporter ATP-binding protein [Actinospica acidithermotolerans]MBR7826342.1 ABC transporter ATP-binding protein [Actinospica acidithermotolerans]